MVFTRVGMMDDYRNRQNAERTQKPSNSEQTITGYETRENTRVYHTRSKRINGGVIAADMEQRLGAAEGNSLDDHYEMTDAGYPAMTVQAAVAHARKKIEMYSGAGAADPVEHYYGPEEDETSGQENPEIMKLASLIQYPINTYAEGQLVKMSQKRDMIRTYGFCIPACNKPKNINRKKLLGKDVKGLKKEKGLKKDRL